MCSGYYGSTSEDALGYFWPANASHTPASAKIYIRVVGFDSYNGAGYWRFELVTTDISLPLWFAIPLASFTVMLGVVFPVALAIEFMIAQLVGGLLDGVVQVAELGVAAAGNSALSKVSASALQTVQIPGSTLSAAVDIHNFGVGSDGGEAWLKVTATNSAAPTVGLKLNASSLRTGTNHVDIFYDAPSLELQVVTPPSFADAASVYVEWRVVRKDTNATIVSRATRLTDPGGGALSVDRTTPDLQAVSEFSIVVSIFRPGSIDRYSADVSVVDWLDRSRRFVKWTSHTWFADPKKPKAVCNRPTRDVQLELGGAQFCGRSSSTRAAG